MERIHSVRDWWRSVRYGDEIVHPRRAREIFLEVANDDLSAHSFDVERERFVKHVDDDIVQLVELVSLRGAYCLRWGVSLSFVPHRWEQKIEWHRTRKSARPDLFEAPAVASELPLHEFDLIIADGTHGEAFFRKDVRRLWRSQGQEIFNWLTAVTTIEAVARKAREQRLGPPNWHWPPPRMIEAFALAKLGRESEGRDHLEQIIQEHRESLEPVENLRRAFDTIEARK